MIGFSLEQKIASRLWLLALTVKSTVRGDLIPQVPVASPA